MGAGAADNNNALSCSFRFPLFCLRTGRYSTPPLAHTNLEYKINKSKPSRKEDKNNNKTMSNLDYTRMSSGRQTKTEMNREFDYKERKQTTLQTSPKRADGGSSFFPDESFCATNLPGFGADQTALPCSLRTPPQRRMTAAPSEKQRARSERSR